MWDTKRLKGTAPERPSYGFLEMTPRNQNIQPRICVVDDDPSICRALTRLIKSHGLNAVSFASAEDFLGEGRERETDCLVLDVHLFGMSGFELQDHLAGAKLNIPIIFITAQDDVGSRERAMKGGALAYLRKPFDDEALIEAIRKAVN